MASCTQPAGSTVTPVTCAAKEAGSVVATRSPAASLLESTVPGDPGACGTVSSSRPGGRVADSASTRPSPLSESHVPSGPATTKRGVSSVTAMCTPSGHDTWTDADRTHGSCSIARRRRAGVDIEQRWMGGQPSLCHDLRGGLVHVAGHRHRAGREQRGVNQEPGADEAGQARGRDDQRRGSDASPAPAGRPSGGPTYAGPFGRRRSRPAAAPGPPPVPPAPSLPPPPLTPRRPLARSWRRLRRHCEPSGGDRTIVGSGLRVSRSSVPDTGPVFPPSKPRRRTSVRSSDTAPLGHHAAHVLHQRVARHRRARPCPPG